MENTLTASSTCSDDQCISATFAKNDSVTFDLKNFEGENAQTESNGNCTNNENSVNSSNLNELTNQDLCFQSEQCNPSTNVENKESDHKNGIETTNKMENMEIEKLEPENVETNVIKIFINLMREPKLMCTTNEVYNEYKNNYIKGCQWSPDGTCLLSASNDNKLRIYELPKNCTDTTVKQDVPNEIKPVLTMKIPELIYDYKWYPLMNSNYPQSCFLACTSRQTAVTLWDAYYGTERLRFQPKNHMDEAVIPYSLAFTRDGYRLICGFNKFTQIFDVTQLSSNGIRIPKLGIKSELRGIISTISTSPFHHGMFACGSYSGDAGIFHESLSTSSDKPVIEFLRNDMLKSRGGITQIEFSPHNEHMVATGSRRPDGQLHIWDLRNAGCPMFAIAERMVATNQKIPFCFDPSGRYLVSGDHRGCMRVYSLFETTESSVSGEVVLKPMQEWPLHADVVGGLSIHPWLGYGASGCGQRRLMPVWNTENNEEDDSSSSEEDFVEEEQENCVKIWKFDVDSFDDEIAHTET